MDIVIAKNWWSLVLRGCAAILVGVITFVWPEITLGALVLLFGAYAIIDGVLAVAGAVRAAEAHQRWGALLFEGIAGVAAGVVTFAWPAITALALIYVIAAWALITGAFEIASAVRLRKYISHEWLLALSGAASLILGLLMIALPMVGGLAIALWVGVYALVFGALEVALGIRLRSWMKGGLGHPSITAPAY